MHVYEALAEEVQRCGVSVVFGLAGEDTVKLGAELAARGVTYHSTRHESSAVAMAAGYARCSGEVGVALISVGPGLTNALTALVWAAKARAPLVVLVGAVQSGMGDPARARAAISEPKYVKQGDLLAATGVRAVTLSSPASAAADLSAVFDCARSGVTIAVNLPKDVLDAEAGADSSTLGLPTPSGPVLPEAAALAAVADLLQATFAARRPVILAGRGAVIAGARDDLERLGSITGSLMCTTLLAKSLFAGNSFDVGVAGSFSSSIALELLAQADLLLVFGASLNPLTTYRGQVFPKARVIQFDSDASAFGRFSRPEIAVHADARQAAVALASELAARSHSFAGYRTPEVAERIASFKPEPLVDQSRPGAVDPNAFMIAMEKILPRERAVVVDGGHQLTFGCAHLSVPEPNAFIFPIEYYSIGLGLGAAIGAALARPDRLTVLSIGDGGLMMNLGDLHTAVRLRLPLLVLICNDFAFGSEMHLLQLYGLPDETSRYENPSFEALAKGMGMDAITVDSLADLTQLEGRLDRLDRPLLVDCRVNPEVRADWVGFFTSTARDRGAD